MATTVTIDAETLGKLGDLKTMLRAMGSTEYFKTDIVRNTVDDLHEDVRTAYYEERAAPFLRERRFERHADLLSYWTRERIVDELFHDGYREEYREAYGVKGNATYVRDIRERLIDLCEWTGTHPEWQASRRVPLDTEDAVPSMSAVMYRDDDLYVPHRGIGNACEIARHRVRQMAADTLVSAGVEIDDPWSCPYLEPTPSGE